MLHLQSNHIIRSQVNIPMYTFYMEPLFWVLVAGLLGQLYIYLILFRKVISYKPAKDANIAFPGISVIISARNEEENLIEKLPSVLEQDYPAYEVIVVNDQSEDQTKEVLENLAAQYPQLKIVTIEEHVNEFAGKKLALTLGIKASSYETLLFTDADCKPLTDQWLKSIAEAYPDENKEIVLGYSPYRAFPSFLNAMIRFDTWYTAMQYFSMALSGKPYMGVGRNLSYKKELFFRGKGFAPYLKVASGDDDLFVNMHANPKNTAVQLDKDSFVLSEPKQSWGDWIRQKRRHLLAGRYYHTSDKRALAFIWLSNLFFYAAFVVALLFVKPFWISLAVFGLRLIVQGIITNLSMQKLYVKGIWPLYPILDVIYQLIYIPLISFLSLFRRKRKW